ncbi:glycosyltransferase family 4 protein [Kushneria sinocarnis]|nr:glycosyltransferase family 4 protein [Kushneria sinocarnis]
MPSGIERVTSVIANRLAEQGVAVSIVSLWGGLEPFYPKHEAVSLHQLFSSQVRSASRWVAMLRRLGRVPLASWRLRQLLRQYPQDILIDTDYLLGQVALPAVPGMSVRHVHWEHFSFNLDLDKPHKLLGRRLIARATRGIVTLTQRDREYWLKGARVRGEIAAIPNPVPFEMPETTYQPDTFIVLAVGRLNYQKGFDRLIESWAEMKNEKGNDVSHWTLRILGDGEEEHELKQKAHQLGVNDSIEFLPATKDVDHYYRNASILAMTSRFEGFPMVLLEAQSYGLPIVAFDCDTGPAEIISDGESGFLVAQGDTHGFAHQLASLIQDSELRMKFSANARDSVSRFKPEAIVVQWNRYLENLMSTK